MHIRTHIFFLSIFVISCISSDTVSMGYDQNSVILITHDNKRVTLLFSRIQGITGSETLAGLLEIQKAEVSPRSSTILASKLFSKDISIPLSLIARDFCIDLNEWSIANFDQKTIRDIFYRPSRTRNYQEQKNFFQAVHFLQRRFILHDCFISTAVRAYINNNYDTIDDFNNNVAHLHKLNICNLDLHRYGLNSLPDGFLEALGNQRTGTLDISENQLTSFDLSTILKNFPRLLSLKCDRNQLNKIDFNLSPMSALCQDLTINLCDNCLSEDEIFDLAYALRPGFFQKYKPQIYQLTDRTMIRALGQTLLSMRQANIYGKMLATLLLCELISMRYLIDNDDTLLAKIAMFWRAGVFLCAASFFLNDAIKQRFAMQPDYKGFEFQQNKIILNNKTIRC
jgi:hypothetical protein